MSLTNRIDLIHKQDTPLSEEQLFTRVEGSVRLPRGLTHEQAVAIFEEARKKAPRMSDKQRFFLDHIADNILYCTAGQYSDFYATLEMKQKLLAEGALTDAQLQELLDTGFSILGLCTVCETSGGGIILQRRSNDVTQARGAYMLPAGGYMPEDIPEGQWPTPFISARKQVFNEQGFHLNNLVYLGMARDTVDADNPACVFATALDLDQQAVLHQFKGARDKYETELLKFIPSDEEGLLRTMRGEYRDVENRPFSGRVLGVCLGALLLFGNVEHGPEWFNAACAEAVKNKNPEIGEVRIYNTFSGDKRHYSTVP